MAFDAETRICRQIFFEMGFVEMPTNQYVETGFWVSYRHDG
jgi:phenylalanyl-tRNA synthetase alpha subunit